MHGFINCTAFPTRGGIRFPRCDARRRNLYHVQMRSKGPLQLAKDAQTVYTAQKPPWCQPWTIVSSGTGIIALSWRQLHGWMILLAIAITMGVVAWWLAFLVAYPQAVLNNE